MSVSHKHTQLLSKRYGSIDAVDIPNGNSSGQSEND